MITTRDRLGALVEALYAKTLDGSLEWSASENVGAVKCVVGSSLISLDEEPSDRFETDYRVTIYNRNGDQVDTFNDTLFYGMNPKRFEISSFSSLMENLLESARRRASGADAVLNQLLVDLEAPPIEEPVGAQAQPRPSAFGGELDDDVPF